MGLGLSKEDSKLGQPESAIPASSDYHCALQGHQDMSEELAEQLWELVTVEFMPPPSTPGESFSIHVEAKGKGFMGCLREHNMRIT